MTIEIKDHIKWHRKMDKERVDKFEPPLWDDITSMYVFDWFNQGCHYRFVIDKLHDYIIVINFNRIGYIFDKPATKENYEKACKYVGKLFKEVK